MKIELHPVNPQKNRIDKIVEILRNDGVIIYPTDSAYSFGCSMESKKAIKTIYNIKKLDGKTPLTFICSEVVQFSKYTSGMSSNIFRVIQKVVPGPYTFIMRASTNVPRDKLGKRKTIGVRIPDAPIPLEITRALGAPLLSSAVEVLDKTDWQYPDELYDRHSSQIDALISGGEVLPNYSTVIDFSEGDLKLVRMGAGDITPFEP